jgi:hypothetical protein
MDRLSTNFQYLGASAVRILLPQIIIGTKRSPIAKAIQPLRIYILVKPMVFIHGTKANGTATETAFRRKATPMNASAVSCRF